MKRFKLIIFTSVLFYFNIPAFSNDSIINEYIKVIEIFNYNYLDRDSVRVSGSSTLSEGDTIIVYQAKGADWDSVTGGPDVNYGFAGRFEYHIVYKTLGDTVILLSNLNYLINNVTAPLSSRFNKDHSVQIIKVPSYQKYVTTNKLTATAWDGDKGGIFAIIADTLVLNNNIDVTGKGFRGADPSADTFNGTCSRDYKPGYNRKNFTISAQDSAGLKGESVVVFDSLYRRGCLPLYNGGGGGNGRYSGGGGGAGWGVGGRGGVEIETCYPCYNDSLSITGQGGRSLSLGVLSDPEVKAVFGGGGGCSTQKPSGNIASKGGNGGGIILLMVNYLIANNDSIIANGQSVSATCSAGAGGGGGGGAVLFDVNHISGNLYINVKGGKGGSTSIVAGPGGGGGGGYIYYNGDTIDATLDESVGNKGISASSYRQAMSGGYGKDSSNLHMPANDFLFNIMPEDQKICAGQQPKKLIASKPKGGNGVYSYEWIERNIDSTNWEKAQGQSDGMEYQPPVLTDTMFYRRIVKSFNTIMYDSISDTSYVLAINVLPVITENYISISVQDTLCYGINFPQLNGTIPKGGDSKYIYQWQDSISQWQSALGKNDTVLYQHDYEATTKFRRIVYSGKNSQGYACIDTSNYETITVLPLLSNFNIEENQWISEGIVPEPVKGDTAIGGDGNYIYKWQTSIDSLNWNDTLVANNFINSLPFLSDTMFYRRLVFSGENNTCSDTSNIISIYVIDSIENNFITGNDTICGKTNAGIIKGTKSKGGNGIYNYLWEKLDSSSSWNECALIINGDTTYNPGSLDTTSYYRRIVISEERCSSCKDTSGIIKITVRPYIRNNKIYNNDTTICYNQSPGYIYGAQPYNGDGPYNFTWQVSTDNYTWQAATGISNQQNYLCEVLKDTLYIRRKIISGVCESYSDTLKIVVLDTINNNVIGSYQHICEGSMPDSLIGTQPSGGDRQNYYYTWLQSSDSILWAITPGINSGASYKSDNMFNKLHFIRIVKSGFNNCCEDTSNILTIDIFKQPKDAFAGDDQEGRFMFNTTLHAKAPDIEGASGTWSSTDNDIYIESPSDTVTQVNKLKLGENYFIWTITNGTCVPVSDTVIVYTTDIKVPNGFSPNNNDTINDKFKIIGLNYVKNAKLTILNKWGIIVYHSDDYKNDWDGTYKGNDLPEDTYFFILNVIGNTYKGFVVIKR